MNEIPSTGGFESPFDNRDRILATAGAPEILPEEYENSVPHAMSRMYQRQIGACVGHTLAKAAREYWFRKTGQTINFSPRFLYAIAKCQDGFSGEGTYPRLVADILRKYGCATEATCPNDTTLDHETYVYNRKMENIPASAFAEAEQYKISQYKFVPLTEYSIKQAIHQYGFVSILLDVGEEWWTSASGFVTWLKQYIDPLRHPKVTVSGHEIGFTGWSNPDYKTVDNHWSVQWADQGFNKLSWADYSRFIREAIVLVDEAPAPSPDYIFTQDMKYGETSDAVKQLQKKLIKLGYSIPSGPTNYFGDQTRTALIKFQDDNKIPLTLAQRYIKWSSIAGPKTREALNKK